jgi:hypothetical protein
MVGEDEEGEVKERGDGGSEGLRMMWTKLTRQRKHIRTQKNLLRVGLEKGWGELLTVKLSEEDSKGD